MFRIFHAVFLAGNAVLFLSALAAGNLPGMALNGLLAGWLGWQQLTWSSW